MSLCLARRGPPAPQRATEPERRPHILSDVGPGRKAPTGSRLRPAPLPLAGEKAMERTLPDGEAGGTLAYRAQGAGQPALLESLEQGRVHVVRAADRPRGVQACRYGVDARTDLLRPLALSRAGGLPAQRFGRQQAAGPGAEVLGRELLAGGAAQVVVDVLRAHGRALARLREVLEQPFARQRLAARHQPRQPAVEQLAALPLAQLAAELEHHARPSYAHVPVPQGRESVRRVVLRVLFVAYAQARVLQQREHRRDDLRAGQTRALEVAAHAPAQGRQVLGEGGQAVELGLVAHGAPARVV